MRPKRNAMHPARRPVVAALALAAASCGGGGGGSAGEIPATERIGTPTAATLGRERATLQTGEFLGSSSLERDRSALLAIKADAAYSRGWTGAGSLALVMDSGIDAAHPEFQGQIEAAMDLTDDSGAANDPDGHGTGVASVLAGRRHYDRPGTCGSSGSGLPFCFMHGVAFDAKLLVAKVTASRTPRIDIATELTAELRRWNRALSWGEAQGATVANLSRGLPLSNLPTSDVTDRGDGIYTIAEGSPWSRFGFGAAALNAREWQRALGADSEMVLVVAAGGARFRGQQGRPYPNFPGVMATETDDDGNLRLGGRMLVVGSWDFRGMLTSTSNGAGHLCRNWDADANTCNDPYRIRDFFLLAPTAPFIAAADRSIPGIDRPRYVRRSGTSVAAPQVAGAVAILRQMWPYMSGRDLARLLLTTADKSIPGYDPNVHGQGLLDLDAATRPVGAAGIPMGGSAAGASLGLGAGAAGSGIELQGMADALARVMVLDSFRRDFYVNLGAALAASDRRGDSPFALQGRRAVRAAAPAPYDAPYDAYAQLLAPDGSLALPLARGWRATAAARNASGERHLRLTTGDALRFPGRARLRWNLGGGELIERHSFLGAGLAGAVAVGQGHRTRYLHLGAALDTDGPLGLDLYWSRGRTRVATAAQSLIRGVDALDSEAWAATARLDLAGGWRLGAGVARPLRVVSGAASLSVPVARAPDGGVTRRAARVSLAPVTPETDYGLYLARGGKHFHLLGYAEMRDNYLNRRGRAVFGGGLELRWEW
ncbi:MAG: S8 family serine peptidase [Gammaproteobacteria bacterium]|nr:S8 family serine peptidase [Gammaproteobacteria bacterium]